MKFESNKNDIFGDDLQEHEINNKKSKFINNSSIMINDDN